jgi:hypothetical protein
MSTTSVDKNEGQYPSTLYSYPEQLFYLAYSSSHLYGCSLSLKLLSLHFKPFKDCALWSKASLKRWLGPQVARLVFQVIQRQYLVPQGTTTSLPQLFRSFWT